MNRKTKFIKDIMHNTLAFGVYIAAFHLLMMPYLAKNLEISTNAKLLLYIMISNILTMSLGNELGVLYQVISGRRPDANNTSDLRRLFYFTNVVLGIIMAILLPLLKFSLVETLMLIVITLLTNSRFFIQGYLRLKKKFKVIGYGNLLYLSGVIFSILIAETVGLVFWVPLLFAELFSIAYLYKNTSEFRKFPVKQTEFYKSNKKEYFELIGATLMTNIPIYADKLLVLPLLGDKTMSAYYAGTVLSKILFLIINPINGVLLSWLVSDRVTEERVVVRRQLKVNMIVLGIVFMMSLPLTFVMMKLFYSQFFDLVMTIIIPLALISSFSIASSLLRVVFLRYFELKSLKLYNLIHIISFLILAPLGAYVSGIVGFTYGVGLSKVVLWLIFYVKLAKRSTDDELMQMKVN